MHLYELHACFALISSALVCVVVHPSCTTNGAHGAAQPVGFYMWVWVQVGCRARRQTVFLLSHFQDASTNQLHNGFSREKLILNHALYPQKHPYFYSWSYKVQGRRPISIAPPPPIPSHTQPMLPLCPLPHVPSSRVMYRGLPFLACPCLCARCDYGGGSGSSRAALGKNGLARPVKQIVTASVHMPPLRTCSGTGPEH